jgi:excisionase family DNA binding protein
VSSKLLSVPEIAQRLNVTERWVRRAIFERRFPVVRLGRLVRVDEHDLETFIHAQRVEPEEVTPVGRLKAAR